MTLESRLIVGGLALAVVHNIDEAFVHHEAGGVANLAIGVTLCALAALFYRRLPWWRGIIAVVVGLNAAAQAAVGHVAHLADGTSKAGDWSGLAMVAGGLLLIAAGAMALRHRPSTQLSAIS